MAASATTIELPPAFQQRAEDWVRAGRFRSVQDAAMAALTHFQENEDKCVKLGSQIDDALAQHGRGELAELEDGEFSHWLNSQ